MLPDGMLGFQLKDSLPLIVSTLLILIATYYIARELSIVKETVMNMSSQSTSDTKDALTSLARGAAEIATEAAQETGEDAGAPGA